MATEEAEATSNQDSVWKRALLVIGALVGFSIIWFVLTSFMMGFAQGAAGLNTNSLLIMIAAGVFVAPFAHVLFGRVVDYIIEQM